MQLYRGFKSHSLRQFALYGPSNGAFFVPFPRYSQGFGGAFCDGSLARLAYIFYFFLLYFTGLTGM